MEDFFIPRAGALLPWHPRLFLPVLKPFAPMSLSMTMISIWQQGLSLAWSSPIRLDGLAYELQGPPVSVFPEPELQACAPELGVFM